MNIQMATASSSLSQTQKKMDTIANNIANVNTAGYKSREATFQNLLTQTYANQTGEEAEPGRVTPENLRVGFGSKVGLTTLRNEQGSAQKTGRNLDVMLEGENVYFRVQNGDAINYTRDGSFEIQNQNGVFSLVTSRGNTVLDPNGNAITFRTNPSEVSISDTGELAATDSNGNEQTFQLSIAKIDRPQALMNVGGNEFSLQENGDLELVALDGAEYKTRQGYLEMSNVDLTNETTEMISTQRLLQFQSQAIKMADEMMGLANTIKR
ncbi:flagellar hook-basal body protein [Alkalihalobacillus hwajinpoensis]|uniref:flagellar hook-basal body protein n=1 Tax=Guptibacillus hwajinpoensis TaxID=208199 RepID=UPI00188380EF|nr:flagellar hook-basal body protein [Pseudalkalibacillus hwajinpoensis]MBF0705151.1 flagellar hook-basal body protein [Pseudalkalibacillus hwajinpoensis]